MRETPIKTGKRIPIYKCNKYQEAYLNELFLSGTLYPPLKTGTFSLTPTVKIFPVAKLFCEPFDYQ